MASVNDTNLSQPAKFNLQLKQPEESVYTKTVYSTWLFG